MELERVNMRNENYKSFIYEIHRCGKLGKKS